MSVVRVVPPFEVFPDVDGDPLDSGSIYVGQAGLNPEVSVNQLPVFWDITLTIPAAQPIRTLGGFPIKDGAPASFYVDAVSYSISVRNKNGSLVYSDLFFNIGDVNFGSPILCKTVAVMTGASITLVNGKTITPAEAASFANTGTIIRTTWNNSTSKRGGADYEIKTLTQHRLDMGNPTWVPDGYGDHYLFGGTEYVAVMIIDDGKFYVDRFGARCNGVLPDGTENPDPHDDYEAIQACLNRLKRGTYPEFQGGSVWFSGGVNRVYCTSGLHTLPEARIYGDQCKIKPLGNPEYIFKIDLRHTANSRRFCKDWFFGDFTMYCPRGFGVNRIATDCGHFLYIDGGWLIRSEIKNIDTDPGFSCNSLVEWDLTHRPGVNEVGVPDAILFDNISAQFAENTSYAISFSGDTEGTLSRIGSTTFSNIYNSIVYPHDYKNRALTTNDFGVIRSSDVRIARAKVYELYGYNPIRQFGTSSFTNGTFGVLYVEFNAKRNSDYECILRGGSYVNCNFGLTFMYTENANLDAPPKFFDAVFTNCTFDRVAARVQSILNNPPDVDFFKLNDGSSGNRFVRKPIFENNPPEKAGMPWILRRFTVPKDTKFEFIERQVIDQTPYVTVSGNGEFLVGSCPNDLAELNTDFFVQGSVRLASAVNAKVQLKLEGDGISGTPLTSQVIDLASGDDLIFRVRFSGRSDVNPNPSYNQFNNTAVVSFEIIAPGMPAVIVSGSVTNQFNSGSYDVKLIVTDKTSGEMSIQDLETLVGFNRSYVNFL